MLLKCVYKIIREAGVEQDATLVLGAHYLSGIAKALIEDLSHGILTGPVRPA